MTRTDSDRLERTERQPTLSRLGTSILNALHMLLGVALLFVVAVNVLNAIGRYTIGVSPVGMDELMVYVVIWSVMLAAILSLIQRSHINVNLLPLYVKGRGRHVLNVIHALAALVSCAFAAYASWLFIGRLARVGVRSMGLGLPMAIPHSALFAGFAGLALAAAIMLVRDAIAFLRNEPSPEANP